MFKPAHHPEWLAHRLATLVSATAAAAVLLALVPAVTHAAPVTGGDDKATCAYGANNIQTFESFETLVGRTFDCAMVGNDAAPTWAAWELPWFIKHPDPRFNWANWKAAAPNRQLIITQTLFPDEVDHSNWAQAASTRGAWLQAGARGDYAAHARAFAANLVAAGLGDSVIRLAHEANGTWYADSLGTNDQEFTLWVQFWRNTVLAMKSVPGAHFRFDWCLNAAYRALPLAKIYPGDDVVDVIGLDAYDSGIANVPAGSSRWSTIYSRPGGIADVLAFAKAHGKPLSFPEWGVSPPTVALGGGDDPTYVDGIASVVRNNRFAYLSYFYAHDWAAQLAPGTLSLAAYVRHFGPNGDSTGARVAPDATSVPPSSTLSAPGKPSSGSTSALGSQPKPRPTPKPKAGHAVAPLATAATARSPRGSSRSRALRGHRLHLRRKPARSRRRRAPRYATHRAVSGSKPRRSRSSTRG